MKKYTKAVSATLAGALAVGMVPAMALADTVDDSVELQTLTGKTAFDNGKITAAVDHAGNAIDLTKAIKFTLGDAPYFLVQPTEVTPKGDAAVKVDDVLYKVDWYKVNGSAAENIPGTTVKGDKIEDALEDNDELASNEIKTTGEYYAVVTAANAGGLTTEYDQGVVAIKFEVVSPVLEGAAVYEINAADDKDASDRTFVYTGEAYTWEDFGAVNASGKILKQNVNGDFIINSYHYDNGTGSYDVAPEMKGVGNYALKLAGKSLYDGQTYYAPFSIVAFDLSKAAGLTHASVVSGNTTVSADNVAIPGLKNVVSDANFILEPKTTADTISQYSALGTYTYIIKPKTNPTEATVARGVTGQAEVSVDVVANAFSEVAVTYNGKPIADAFAASTDIDLGAVSPKLFDENLIKVTAGLQSLPFTVVVTKADGTPASVEDINTKGDWKVSVKVDGKDNGYQYAGMTEAVDIVTVAPAVNLNTEAAFKYNGKTTASIQHIYDGSDILANVTTVVTANGGSKQLVAGTDYTVKVEKLGKDGVTYSAVEEIVDAGTYRLTLESKSYNFGTSGASIPVTVSPVTVTPVLSDVDITTAGVYDAFWTGKAINPVVKFTKNVPGVAEPVEVAVPADAYFVKVTSPAAKEIKAEGIYEIAVKDNVAGDNYTVVDGFTATVKVTKAGPYLDVPSDAWFADEVLAAKNLNYMTGYYGGDTFGPYDSAERQDVAIVIGRMAGIDFNANLEGSVSNGTGYVSTFSDVVEGAYYAKAVQWADKAGIMTGYSTSDEFGVNDDVKRQDLVVALYRYAQKYQKGFAAPKDVAGALAAYKDGAEVSGYAKTAVAWAIENGIMGVDTAYLNPKSDITRAEVAAMTVRLQPEAL